MRQDKFSKPRLILYVCGMIPVAWCVLIHYRNYRRREEHGSAKWGSPSAVNRKYANKVKTENKILTQNVAIGLDGRQHRRNLNILCCGGSGAGKTRYFAKDNIMNCNTSFVVLDPNGQIQIR